MIKFNFYSKLMLQTITVQGIMSQDWSTSVFKIKVITNQQRQEVVSSDVHNEAKEYFDLNQKELLASSKSN